MGNIRQQVDHVLDAGNMGKHKSDLQMVRDGNRMDSGKKPSRRRLCDGLGNVLLGKPGILVDVIFYMHCLPRHCWRPTILIGTSVP